MCESLGALSSPAQLPAPQVARARDCAAPVHIMASPRRCASRAPAGWQSRLRRTARQLLRDRDIWGLTSFVILACARRARCVLWQRYFGPTRGVTIWCIPLQLGMCYKLPSEPPKSMHSVKALTNAALVRRSAPQNTQNCARCAKDTASQATIAHPHPASGQRMVPMLQATPPHCVLCCKDAVKSALLR